MRPKAGTARVHRAPGPALVRLRRTAACRRQPNEPGRLVRQKQAKEMQKDPSAPEVWKGATRIRQGQGTLQEAQSSSKRQSPPKAPQNATALHRWGEEALEASPENPEPDSAGTFTADSALAERIAVQSGLSARHDHRLCSLRPDSPARCLDLLSFRRRSRLLPVQPERRRLVGLRKPQGLHLPCRWLLRIRGAGDRRRKRRPDTGYGLLQG